MVRFSFKRCPRVLAICDYTHISIYTLQDCIQQTVCHHGASMSGVSPHQHLPPHTPSVRTKGQTCAAAPLGRPVSTQLRCPGAGNLITNIDLSPPCEPVLVSCYPAPHHCPCPSRGYNEDVTGHLIGTGHHTVRPTPCKHTLLEDHVYTVRGEAVST